MKIVVCVSHVPDTATKIKISADEKNIDSAGVSYVINPYDEFAIEEALKTKEKIGGEVYVVTIGNEAAKESLRKALAMGADEAIHLKYDGYLDSLNVAKNLAEEIKSLNSQLVFMGKQSIDFDNCVVPQMTAELLDYNSISVCVSFSLDGNKVTCEREIEGGKEVVESQLPIIVGAQKGLNEPRYASLKGIMAAKKKTIQEKNCTFTNNSVELIKIKKPASKNPGRILGTDVSVVPELVRLLREEAKAI
ncbi:MAG: electron transfer flavoprotein subunit beta [Chlorobiaceae bacterium]|nr:electron transfer flavoprotein subunit beta [Chlorobiaceae bacterium]MBA4309713.1 electron transfer flavoprotein subunit beta [Chlorobiaceae bacterium]